MQAGLVDSKPPRPSVLITGCNGYVGRNLIKLLGDTVNFIGVDCMPGGNESELIDLRDATAYTQLDKYTFDYVLHCAWDQISQNIYENNMQCARNLFNYLDQKTPQGLIFISSSFASTTTGIQYTRSKIAFENMLFDSGIPFIIIRPDMLYSADEKKMQEHRSYMKKGFAICIGNGQSLRSPTHINDLVQLVHRIITTKQFTNKVYEIGSPIPYSQEQILRIVAASIGRNPFIVKIPTLVAQLLFQVTKKVDPEQARTIGYDRVADLRALREDFDLQPRDFNTGVTQ